MQVRPVRMRVGERLVAVPVAVEGRRRSAGMLVQMVAVVVAVGVDVLERVVPVRMGVTSAQVVQRLLDEHAAEWRAAA